MLVGWVATQWGYLAAVLSAPELSQELARATQFSEQAVTARELYCLSMGLQLSLVALPRPNTTLSPV